MTVRTVITDPADWREGDTFAFTGVLLADGDGDLYIQADDSYSGPYVRIGGMETWVSHAGFTTVTRPAPALPTKPGTVFRAEAPHLLDTFVFEVDTHGEYKRPGWLTSIRADWIDPTTVEILWEPEP